MEVAEAGQVILSGIMWTGFSTVSSQFEGKQSTFPFPHSPNTLICGLESS